MSEPQLHHLAAFSAGDAGGNPAGVWIGDRLPSATEMQRIAADVGASETAFVAPARGSRRTIRYFSPEIEVTFCGHATIATGIVLGGGGVTGAAYEIAALMAVTVGRYGSELAGPMGSFTLGILE